ncbi:MAG: CaiB/BaiF CoA-transferase family protein [Pseudomonadota bacterium]|nr:CaiB/BaiF CoA-transferase family protein [Pseudomonadota bacterium]
MTKEEFYREAHADSAGPLADYRVLEVTQAVAGPVVGTVFADLGADVLRCELPGQGDMTRWLEPYLDGARHPNSACWNQSINRGKRGISLDIRQPEGQALFRQLARDCDVLVENFTPGSMKALGLHYGAIREVNPTVVYVSVSGFGQWGPLSRMRGVDTVAQAVSGMMDMNGVEGGEPLISTANLVDHLTGWQGAIGALAALLHRERTGEGQYIDVALADTALYASDQRIMAAHNGGKRWPRMGNTIDMGAPMNCYRCADGRYVYLFAILDTLWPRVCKVMGREELIDDERCNSMVARAQNRHFVDQVTADWVARHDRDDVVRQMQAAGISIGPVLEHGEVAQFEQFLEHESVVDIDHPRYGTLRTYGIVPKFSRTPARVRGPAPDLGQHNDEVLGGELGLDDDRLAALREQRVI